MNRIDKDHRPELWSDVPTSVDHLLCALLLISTVFRWCNGCSSLCCYTQLNSGGVCVLYVCETLKCLDRAVVVTVPWHHFQHRNCECSTLQWSPGNIIFICSQRSSCTSHAATVRPLFCNYGSWIYCGFAGYKAFNVLTIYCNGAYSICDKSPAKGHHVYEQQAISSTMVATGSHTFSIGMRRKISCNVTVQLYSFNN